MSDFILDQLEEAIILKEFLSNEQLPSERELATLFNCSRITLRDALSALENKGLIEKRLGAKGGTFVLPVTQNAYNQKKEKIKTMWSELLDLFEFRLIIEPEAAKLAADRRSTADLDKLELLLHQSQSETISREEFRSIDVKIHLLIGQASGNAYIASDVRKIRTRINPALDLMPFSHEVKSSTITHHKQLIDAFKRKDATLAKDIMYQHIHGTSNAVAKRMSLKTITHDET
ncbi:FadR/GntR family transcriptional regulator [Alkalicoccobacillus murimartini]|uniref:DNA-binding FadR family transcriptional regulator n=1 Tax=Alkalicoccobacillus murimartini TaxID=171685 RepID=A0ABT9YD19_9BACI|nr:FCD domain-containing protein [Alkalicoccobacillus murimartini]MDQ0205743.1 DNA-binding FadR family transcriptional regulator [Alkalicoccobacillus murimartini]